MKLLVIAGVIGASLFVGQPAECAYCPTYTCYGSCIDPCVCLTPPGEVGGRCYGVERAPALLERGYRHATAPVNPDPLRSPSMDPDRAERIAQGAALVQQGHTYRAAAAKVGIPFQTLARHSETLDLDEQREQIAARAVELTARGIDRMSRDIDRTEDRHVASWTLAAAKIGGVLEQHQDAKASDLAELLQRLTAGGNTVSVGVRIEHTQSEHAVTRSVTAKPASDPETGL